MSGERMQWRTAGILRHDIVDPGFLSVFLLSHAVRVIFPTLELSMFSVSLLITLHLPLWCSFSQLLFLLWFSPQLLPTCCFRIPPPLYFSISLPSPPCPPPFLIHSPFTARDWGLSNAQWNVMNLMALPCHTPQSSSSSNHLCPYFLLPSCRSAVCIPLFHLLLFLLYLLAKSHPAGYME